MKRRFYFWGSIAMIRLVGISLVSFYLLIHTLEVPNQWWLFAIFLAMTTWLWVMFLHSYLLFEEDALLNRGIIDTQVVPYNEIQAIQAREDGSITIVAGKTRIEIHPRDFGTEGWQSVLRQLQAHAPKATWDRKA